MNIKNKTILLFLMIVSLALLLTSCSGGAATDVSAGAQEGPVVTAEQEQVAQEGESQAVDSGETGAANENLPEDVPLMPGYRKLLITSDGSNISYEVDGSIDDVVKFYQAELENFGWEMSRSPDNSYSGFGSMSRTNEAGDRVTFSLQHNPVGLFVVVRIVLLRSSGG